MLSTIIWFIIGLISLVGGAELLVRSVSKLAVQFGISKLIIGLTVVAFGTSAPELAVSIQAGIDGQTDLMLGNIVGSNISNIFFILGIAAIIMPLKVNAKLIRVDVPLMIGVTILLFLFALNGSITFWECLVFVSLCGFYLMFLIRENSKTDFSNEELPLKSSRNLNIVGSLAGLAFLLLGARWLVESAVVFAEIVGISQLIIGLTVVSFGTSLPEVATSVAAALKGERDIAVGSVIGSNISNILIVLGISGLFIPEGIPVQNVLLRFDLLILIAASVACIPIFFTGHKISRWEGGMFFFLYISYVTYLFLSAAEHAALEMFSGAMLFFVIPILTVTILTVSYREWKRRQRFKGFGKTNEEK
ncbi:MAG: calcium/sodium antiporter [Balneolaceae bacterium]